MLSTVSPFFYQLGQFVLDVEDDLRAFVAFDESVQTVGVNLRDEKTRDHNNNNNNNNNTVI